MDRADCAAVVGLNRVCRLPLAVEFADGPPM